MILEQFLYFFGRQGTSSEGDSVSARKKRTLAGFDVTKGRGAEIGALSAPLVGKDEAAVYYLDYCSTEDLKRRHEKNAEVHPELIVPVDYVVGGDTIVNVLGDKLPLDYIVASHVIEHVPDLIGWLKDTHDALEVGGRLVLVAPDKRFTFDLFRADSTLADARLAFDEQRKRPGRDHVLDFYQNIAAVSAADLWEDHTVGRAFGFVHDDETIRRIVRKYDAGIYVDVHCWVFTPWSFLALIGDIVREAGLGYDLKYFLTTQPHSIEFYVHLEKQGRSTTDWARAAARARRTAKGPLAVKTDLRPRVHSP